MIQLRFGLTGDEPRTPRQTGMELGITTEQARKLEERGLQRLAGQHRARGTPPGGGKLALPTGERRA